MTAEFFDAFAAIQNDNNQKQLSLSMLLLLVEQISSDASASSLRAQNLVQLASAQSECTLYV